MIVEFVSSDFLQRDVAALVKQHLRSGCVEVLAQDVDHGRVANSVHPISRGPRSLDKSECGFEQPRRPLKLALLGQWPREVKRRPCGYE
jgi:hypothetical protein